MPACRSITKHQNCRSNLNEKLLYTLKLTMEHDLELASNTTEPALPRLIRRRDVAALAFFAALLALVAVGALLGPWPEWKLSKYLNPQTLPGALTGVAMALALLLAPNAATGLRDAAGRIDITALGRTAFIGAWQGAALGFFLVLASRLELLDGAGILRSACALGLAGITAILWAARWPRAYPALAFLWAAALPLLCFLSVEIFSSTPEGAAGLAHAKTAGAERLRATIDWLLIFSPGTAVEGALLGRRLTGTPQGWEAVGLQALAAIATGCVAVFTMPGLQAKPEPQNLSGN